MTINNVFKTKQGKTSSSQLSDRFVPQSWARSLLALVVSAFAVINPARALSYVEQITAKCLDVFYLQTTSARLFMLATWLYIC